MQQKTTQQIPASAGGPCRDCGREHSLAAGAALSHCRELMQLLATEQRLDLLTAAAEADPRLSTAGLFGDNRGKMFGVMLCRSRDGQERVLRAFSGQYNGFWELAGWAPPIFNVPAFTTLYADIEPQIKQVGRQLQVTDPQSAPGRELLQQRRQLSRQWLQEIHRLYMLSNFRGQQRQLSAVFAGNGGIPTGTGDCCAPKLFNQAAQEQLIPLGLAEFYWGRKNASQTRHHGRFYPCCTSKCVPILGFMLCGLDELLTHPGQDSCACMPPT